jgi:hypothetical protein
LKHLPARDPEAATSALNHHHPEAATSALNHHPEAAAPASAKPTARETT